MSSPESVVVSAFKETISIPLWATWTVCEPAVKPGAVTVTLVDPVAFSSAWM